MKVIISEEVKDVKNGYARNFLLPKNLAKIATAENLKILSRKKVERERQEKELLETLKKTAKQLSNLSLDFSLKTGDKGEVFGSISASEIKKTLEKLGYRDFELILEKPLKELGEHLIVVDFGRGIKVEIKIKVHSQP
jgi:large subunit ribosomal protein L9